MRDASGRQFQSLIGRLKTGIDDVETGGHPAFQSLIGRLKTAACVRTGTPASVSIPHR